MNMFESFMKDREARSKHPDFAKEMAKERTEFGAILDTFGKNTFDAGCSALLKVPLETLGNVLKAISQKNYTAERALKDTLTLLLGRDGTVHRTTKAVASAIHLSGKSVRIGFRKLFAI